MTAAEAAFEHYKKPCISMEELLSFSYGKQMAELTDNICNAIDSDTK